MKRCEDNRAHYLISITALVVTRCLVTLGGFVVVILVARSFGATADTDAYFIARLIPITLVSPLAIAYNLVFIPVYTRTRAEQGNQSASHLAGDLLRTTLAASLALTVLYVIFAGWIVKALAPGFSDSARQCTVWMTRVMALAVVLISLHSVLDSLLNADRRFVVSALSSLWIPLGALCGVLVLAGPWGIKGVAIGVLAGFVLQAATLVPMMRRYLTWRGWRVDFGNPELRRAMLDLGLTVLIISVSHITMIVDRMFASLLGEGAVSALSLGAVFIGLVPFVVAFPVYKVVYPELVRLVSEGRNTELRKWFSGNLLLIAFLTLPITVGVALFYDTITDLVFQYGRFSQHASFETAQVIFYLALGLPAAIGVILVFYYFLLVRQTTLIFKVLGLTIVANALLDWILMNLIGIGGIALTSTLITLVRTWCLTLIAARLLGGPIFSGLAVPVAKLSAAAGLAGLAMHGLKGLFDGMLQAGRPQVQLAVLIAAAVLGGAVYLLVNWLLRNDQLWQLLLRVKQPQTVT